MYGASAGERIRRRDALRRTAEANGWQAVVVCGRGDEFMRGRIQYAADIFQWAGWGYLVLPPAGDATFLADPLAGFAQTSSDPWVADVRVTQDPGFEIGAVLSDHGVTAGSVGVVGLGDIAAPMHLRALEAAAPSLQLDDATDAFDAIRGIKSDEEIRNLAETSAILRTVFAALEAELRPGALERDVLAEAHRLCREHGCVDGIAMMARAPSALFSHGTDEAIRREDIIVIDLEWGGPSGYWLELRRCYSFGAPPDRVRRFWDARVEAFEECMAAMRPGASSEAVLAARDRVYRKHGLTAAGSALYSAHGIGIDSLEPPWVPGKERTFEAGMMISLHPVAEPSDSERAAVGAVSVGDNVHVTETGARRMSYDREEWVSLEA